MQPVRTFMLSLALTLAQCSEPAELAPPNPVPMASPHLTVHNWPQDGEVANRLPQALQQYRETLQTWQQSASAFC